MVSTEAAIDNQVHRLVDFLCTRQQKSSLPAVKGVWVEDSKSILVSPSGFSLFVVSIDRVLVSVGRWSENRISAGIPFSVLNFCIEFGKLPPVVNQRQQFPDEQQGHTHSQYTKNDSENQCQGAYSFRTDFGFFYFDLHSTGFWVVIVWEEKRTEVRLVAELANLFSRHILVEFLDVGGVEESAVSSTQWRIILIVQLARSKGLTLSTRF